MQVFADFLAGLDLGRDARRERVGCDGEVGRERDLQGAVEERRDGFVGVGVGVVDSGCEDVAGEDG